MAPNNTGTTARQSFRPTTGKTNFFVPQNLSSRPVISVEVPGRKIQNTHTLGLRLLTINLLLPNPPKQTAWGIRNQQQKINNVR